MGTCLLAISGHDSRPAAQQLQQLDAELTGLVACVAMADPKRLQALHASRLDLASSGSALPPEPNYALILVRLRLLVWV